MNDATIRVLALDLEGTLISETIGVFPRPGLYDFLEWCDRHFERVVLYTCVSEEHARDIARRLADEQIVPAWFQDIEYVDWEGTYKNLRFVEGAEPHEVLLVDDKRIFIPPEQKAQWIPIPSFLDPYPDDDAELDRVRERLIAACARS